MNRTPSASAKLAHPCVWMFAGTAIFLSAWVTPASLYTHYVGDRNYLQFDVRILAYNFACLGSLIAGFWFFSAGKSSAMQNSLQAEDPFSGAPLTRRAYIYFAILLNVLALILFVQYGGMAALAGAVRGQDTLGGQWSEMRGESEESFRIWQLPLIISAIAFPLVVYAGRLRDSASARRLIALYITSFAVVALLTAKRNFISKPLFALILIYFVWPKAERASPLRALLLLLFSAASILVLFVVTSALRKGLSGGDDAIAQIMRYLVGPYNVQSLLMSGDVRFQGSGTGFYWTQWVWDFPVLGDILELKQRREELFGASPPYTTVLRGEEFRRFGITSGTSITAFASTYIDFSWFGPFAWFPIGAIARGLWTSFLRGRLAGLIFYPLIGYSFIEWRANLQFPSDRTSFAICVFMIVLACRTLERAIRRDPE